MDGMDGMDGGNYNLFFISLTDFDLVLFWVVH